jgi:hypothetical protein
MRQVAFFFLLFVIGIYSLSSDVLTPAGYFPSECVHGIENGATIAHSGGNIVVVTAAGETHTIPPCATPVSLRHGEAWKAWTEYNNATAVTSLYGEWQVPKNPPVYSKQTLFFCKYLI